MCSARNPGNWQLSLSLPASCPRVNRNFKSLCVKSWCAFFRTRRIGANPEKIRFSEFPGSGLNKNLVNSVFCCFSWENRQKCSQNPGLVNEFSATPRGQLNWTGPIANSSDFYLPEKLPPFLPELSERERDNAAHTWWTFHESCSLQLWDVRAMRQTRRSPARKKWRVKALVGREVQNCELKKFSVFQDTTGSETFT